MLRVMEWNSELEALVRQNPEDPDAWAVLEDWTLQQGPSSIPLLPWRNAVAPPSRT